VPITVPPLRERAEDIPELTDYLLQQISSELKIGRRWLHPDVLQRIMSYAFPGNIRELRNLLERACILSSQPEIAWIDLPEPATVQATTSSNEIIPSITALSLPEEFHLRSALATWERSVIEQMLLKTKGAKAEAARRLGLSKSDLTYKLVKYGIMTQSAAEPKSVEPSLSPARE
jgi:two-component system, NtrC family, response regulator AtoC